MNIVYNDKTDLLYIGFDDEAGCHKPRPSLMTLSWILRRMTELWALKFLMLPKHVTLDRLLPG